MRSKLVEFRNEAKLVLKQGFLVKQVATCPVPRASVDRRVLASVRVYASVHARVRTRVSCVVFVRARVSASQLVVLALARRLR